MQSNNKLATALAMSAAALFLGGCGKQKTDTATPDAATNGAGGGAAAAVDPSKKVRCYGVNECSGQTACDVAGKWDCGGNNDCCGKGWLYIAKGECDELGGGQDESFLENVAGICEGKAEGAGGDADAAQGEPAAAEDEPAAGA